MCLLKNINSKRIEQIDSLKFNYLLHILTNKYYGVTQIKKMERQLEEQIQLRLAYANAIEITAPPVSNFITEIPDKVIWILANAVHN